MRARPDISLVLLRGGASWYVARHARHNAVHRPNFADVAGVGEMLGRGFMFTSDR